MTKTDTANKVIPVYNSIFDLLASVGFPKRKLEEGVAIDTLEKYFNGKLFNTGNFRTTYYVFVYVTEGSGIVGINNKDYPIGPNIFYFASPGHVRKLVISSAVKGFVMSTTREFATQYYKGEVAKDFPFLGYKNIPPIKVEPPLTECFESLLNNMLKTFSCEEGIYRYQIISNLITAFLFKAKQVILTSPYNEGTSSACSPLVLRFMKLLDDNFRKMVAGETEKFYNVTDLAHILHVHPNYLNNKVRKETGKPVSSWIKEMVMIEAQSLLLNTDLTIAQISEKLRYDEPTNFTKYFKRKVGRTPKEYRIQANLNNKPVLAH